MMVSVHNQELEAAYRQAFERTLVTSHEPVEVIRAEGADHLELLHRLTTNSLIDLGPGSWRPTLLTNSVGRLVDRVLVLAQQGQSCLIPSPTRARAVVEWLNGYIFFQDDVHLELEPQARPHLTVLGPDAADLLGRLAPGAEPLEQGEFSAWQGSLILKIGEPLTGYDLYLSPDSLIAHRLLSELPYSQQAARQAYHALRIERGAPAPERELTPEVIPLEIGLKPEIDFAKGCYIGQEVIARMESRGKVAKTLVRLQLAGEAQPGSAIRSDGRQAGTITSVAFSPELGWIALGLVSTRALDRQPAYLLVGDDGLQAVWRPVIDPRQP